MLSVTGGWHETRVPQLPGEVPDTCYAYLAQAIRKDPLAQGGNFPFRFPRRCGIMKYRPGARFAARSS